MYNMYTGFWKWICGKICNCHPLLWVFACMHEIIEEKCTQLCMAIDANTDVDVVNSDDTLHKVTVTPLQCCLFIEENDIDCEVRSKLLFIIIYSQACMCASVATMVQRCVFIADIDCEVYFCLLQTIELRPARVLLLGPLEEEHTGNNSGRALFSFRNLVSYH